MGKTSWTPDFVYNKEIKCDVYRKECCLTDIPDPVYALLNDNVIYGYKCRHYATSIIAHGGRTTVHMIR
jgi:hypothetical protein